MRAIHSVLAAFLFAGGTGAALADQPSQRCMPAAQPAVPFAIAYTPAEPQRPLSLVMIWAKLHNQGYTDIQSMIKEPDCVEAKGIDQVGRRFRVLVNPVSGQIFDGRFERCDH